MNAAEPERRNRKPRARAPAARTAPAPLLDELIELSRAAGGDPDWVQGGGGNTSVKSADGRRILVKASGASLAELDRQRGWAELDLQATRAILDDPALGRLGVREREREVLRRLQAAVIRPHGARPSVETNLHALLDRVVLHTHPVGLNALLCARGSRSAARRLLEGTGGEPLYVPYVDPGYTLALALREELERHRERHGSLPSVVLLENHGLFVAAGSVEECLRRSRRVIAVGQGWVGSRRVNPRKFPSLIAPRDAGAGRGPRREDASPPVTPAQVRGALLRGGCGPCLVRLDATEEALELSRRPELLRAARRGALTPDGIVYCRTYPLVLPRSSGDRWPEPVRRYRERHGLDPRVVIVPGAGVWYAARDLALLRVVSEVYRSAIVAHRAAPRAGGPRLLSRRQARFIEEWEVEHFRAAAWAGAAARLQGRVGLVTGAASGLGKAIALGLARAGVTVAAADVDRGALEQAAAEAPPWRFLPLPCDVTSEESVRRAFAAVEASLGGLDFLVSAAGIAPAAPLAEFPLAAWRRTLEINLTGYFLCAREAARLLLRQRAGGAVVLVSSKSGLEASKDNSAYNATKAGEIHLMRGWALELGKAGIRVNCVAPGNVFKGSRIWNPEYIRACARKRGIRPEEVIPYYTSLSALGQEIEPEDVAAAVIFLLSEEARNVTGQTLVVDGGQVMVR